MCSSNFSSFNVSAPLCANFYLVSAFEHTLSSIGSFPIA